VFKAFFPTLSSENWSDLLDQKNFRQQELPYQLKIENNSMYGQSCHFCATQR